MRTHKYFNLSILGGHITPLSVCVHLFFLRQLHRVLSGSLASWHAWKNLICRLRSTLDLNSLSWGQKSVYRDAIRPGSTYFPFRHLGYQGRASLAGAVLVAPSASPFSDHCSPNHHILFRVGLSIELCPSWGPSSLAATYAYIQHLGLSDLGYGWP